MDHRPVLARGWLVTFLTIFSGKRFILRQVSIVKILVTALEVAVPELGRGSTQATNIHSQNRSHQTLGQEPTVQLRTGTPAAPRQLLQLGVQPQGVEEGSI